MTPPAVAIIVVTFNSEPLLADLVRSLAPGTGSDVTWRLVVADNQSDDNTVSTDA